MEWFRPESAPHGTEYAIDGEGVYRRMHLDDGNVRMDFSPFDGDPEGNVRSMSSLRNWSEMQTDLYEPDYDTEWRFLGVFTP